MSEHLSFYALDRLRLGEPARPDEHAHLRSCPACDGYAQAAAPTTALPLWLSGVEFAPRPPPPRRRWLHGWRLMLPAFTVAAAAALLAVVPRAGRNGSSGDVREKAASPAVQLYVKRGERTFPWEGRSVRAGDRVRVEVNGAGFGFVSVAGRPAGQERPVLLYDGALGKGLQLLPLSFRVDAEGKQEILSVIFGRRPVPADLHTQARDSGSESGSDDASGGPTWRQILVLEKENP